MFVGGYVWMHWALRMNMGRFMRLGATGQREICKIMNAVYAKNATAL